MAKTAVVNRRKRRGTKRRRRNYSALSGSSTANPRKRSRRRSYGAAKRRRRRRNPASPYASTGYRRSPNPRGLAGKLLMPLKQLADILPAGTAGILGARFALKHSGAWDVSEDKQLEPGLMQALAVYLGAQLTGELIGGIFRSPAKATYAKVAGLAFGGDLFLRSRFLRKQSWYTDNLSLAGYDEDEEDSTEYYDDSLYGFQDESALGEESWTDSDGVTWTAGPDGNWVPMSGMGLDTSKIFQGPDGTLYQLDGMRGLGMTLDSSPGSGARLAGFQNQSVLGMSPAYANPNSSFGYSP